MAEKTDTAETYRVLARKYRPAKFDELIGQDALVKTLSNALEMGRLAHAFVLTGLRGIGKTTTARIIARGLNCTGEDGKGEATLSPCGVCASCTGIAEGRHVDVIEMDAASNTGVDDVREIIEGVGYRPLSARYKIYIIDEVHMLSKSAFNALLKTLEEPPGAVKFIFATTEIRKVPVTVLSRCQRFDLRRVPVDMMAGHLKNICAAENITAADDALLRIARAAEGSVRDALSMLDQAASLTRDNITDDAVAAQLGQAGRQDSLAIIDHGLNGRTGAALEVMAGVVAKGAEPQMVLADMLDLLHLATRIAAGGSAGEVPETEAAALKTLADGQGIARLVRAWQIALKGHGELAIAPDQLAAAEMIVIRLAHAGAMPTPSDLIRKLETAAPAAPASEIKPAPKPETKSAAPVATPVASVTTPPPPPRQEEESSQEENRPAPETMAEMAALFEDNGEALMASYLRNRFRPVVIEPGQFIFAPHDNIDAAMVREITKDLNQWTGLRWVVRADDSDNAAAAPTLREADEESRAAEIAHLRENHPLVAAAVAAFPGAGVSIIPHDDPPPAAPAADDDDDDDGDGDGDDAHDAAAGDAHEAAAAIASKAR